MIKVRVTKCGVWVMICIMWLIRLLTSINHMENRRSRVSVQGMLMFVQGSSKIGLINKSIILA